ncbi:Fic family protein [Microbacterium paludicola]|uniref:Fic family protein n=1 Tax=Microbacterium paludicola TaxID=300019 RepID=UPI00387A6FF0
MSFADAEPAPTTVFRTALVEQEQMRLKGGIYHLTQVAFAYHSNRIEGSRLSEEQTRYLLDTRTVVGDALLDDVIAADNHFRAFAMMLRHVGQPITEDTLFGYHRALMEHVADTHSGLLIAGAWKTRANTVGGVNTTPPLGVAYAVAELLHDAPERMSVEDIVDWHVRFERIHPFQDGNGRVGRLVMFEQCLANDVVPFIVLEGRKTDYFAGLARYIEAPELLRLELDAAQTEYRQRFTPFLPTHREPAT